MEVNQILRLAASKLFRYIPDISISVSYWRLCDLFVKSKTEDFVFGVKVGGSTYTSSNDFAKYVESLNGLEGYDIKIPIIVACVNENSEEVRIGMMTKWMWNELEIFSNPQLVKLNERNGSILYDNIKSMDGVIRMLRNENLGVLKTITITQNQNGRRREGMLFYLRSFTDSYKILKKQLVDEKSKFERFLYGTAQKEYPQDQLDEIFLSGLRIQYLGADVSVNSSILLFNSDIKKLREQINGFCFSRKMTFQIGPDLPDLSEAIMRLGIFKSFQFPIICYSNSYDWIKETILCDLPPEEWAEFSKNYPAIKSTFRSGECLLAT